MIVPMPDGPVSTVREIMCIGQFSVRRLETCPKRIRQKSDSSRLVEAMGGYDLSDMGRQMD